MDIATDPWGIDVTTLELQDIELHESLKRTEKLKLIEEYTRVRSSTGRAVPS